MATWENRKPGRKPRTGSPQSADGNKTEDHKNKQRKKKKKIAFIPGKTHAKN